MPAKDIYHNAVKNALIKAGWTITHDPYTLCYGQTDVFVDIGADSALAAETGEEKIVVRIKNSTGEFDLDETTSLIGQYFFYRSLLKRTDPERKLRFAVPDDVFADIIDEPLVRPIFKELDIAIITINPDRETIAQAFIPGMKTA